MNLDKIMDPFSALIGSIDSARESVYTEKHDVVQTHFLK